MGHIYHEIDKNGNWIEIDSTEDNGSGGIEISINGGEVQILLSNRETEEMIEALQER